MVDYNPKEWLNLVFSVSRADTVRKLTPLILVIGVYTAVLAFLIIDYWKIGENTDLRNISLMHSLLGFVLSMLLVFRTNTAYDRWWEGRKQWGNAVNSSRNLALKINSLLAPDNEKDRKFFQQMIPNYFFSLKNHLRKNLIASEFEAADGFPLIHLNASQHVPNDIAGLLFARLVHLQRTGLISAEELLFVNGEITKFTDVCGACERIKNTPIPYSYSAFLKKFIMFFCLTLPVGYIFSLHYLIIPFVMFIFYVLASLEVIAEEIEDPFGTDANDLPLDRICETIRSSSKQILHAKF